MTRCPGGQCRPARGCGSSKGPQWSPRPAWWVDRGLTAHARGLRGRGMQWNHMWFHRFFAGIRDRLARWGGLAVRAGGDMVWCGDMAGWRVGWPQAGWLGRLFRGGEVSGDLNHRVRINERKGEGREREGRGEDSARGVAVRCGRHRGAVWAVRGVGQERGRAGARSVAL